MKSLLATVQRTQNILMQKHFQLPQILLLSANFSKFSLSQLKIACYSCFKCPEPLQNTEFQRLELAHRTFQVCQCLRIQPVPGGPAVGSKEAGGQSISPCGFNISPIHTDSA